MGKSAGSDVEVVAEESMDTGSPTALDLMKPEVTEMEELQPDWPAFVEWYPTNDMADFMVAHWMLTLYTV